MEQSILERPRRIWRWPHVLRVVLGAGVILGGISLVVAVLNLQLEVCNAGAPVMRVRILPPLTGEFLVAVGVLLIAWPRKRGVNRLFQAIGPWGQAAVSVIGIVLGIVLVALASLYGVGQCAHLESTQPSLWVMGSGAGPVLFALGVVAAIRPASRT